MPTIKEQVAQGIPKYTKVEILPSDDSFLKKVYEDDLIELTDFKEGNSQGDFCKVFGGGKVLGIHPSFSPSSSGPETIWNFLNLEEVKG